MMWKKLVPAVLLLGLALVVILNSDVYWRTGYPEQIPGLEGSYILKNEDGSVNMFFTEYQLPGVFFFGSVPGPEQKMRIIAWNFGITQWRLYIDVSVTVVIPLNHFRSIREGEPLPEQYFFKNMGKDYSQNVMFYKLT